ncbi:hypothetical protein DIE04_29260 [Burkholderia sp. Bp8994]|nr:hypothetical protein DIE04_29260 [Burkholderia sp. Bp8994]RQZ37002.1 hypothetical protein DIE17_36560 [Burkholderia sp. Bp9099]
MVVGLHKGRFDTMRAALLNVRNDGDTQAMWQQACGRRSSRIGGTKTSRPAKLLDLLARCERRYQPR